METTRSHCQRRIPKSQAPSPKSSRPGLTLVELLLFTALLALSTGAIVGFFLLTSESRVRQQVAADVEQNVLQIHQFLSHEIRHAERILEPALGKSGSVLALQSDPVDSSPIIIAVQSGVLLLVRKDSEYALSPPEVFVDGFRVFNASPADAIGSVAFRFSVSRPIPLATSSAYVREAEGAIAVFPDQQLTGNGCGCALPRCDNGLFEWEHCVSGVCQAMSGAVLCPS